MNNDSVVPEIVPLLELKGLYGGYEPVQVFRDVNLTVSNNSSIGLFGPNGHGKSTLLKTISGLIDPWQGGIYFEGVRLNREGERGSRRSQYFNYDVLSLRRINPKQVARAGLIHVSQGNLLFPEMTVNEVLSIASQACCGRANEKESLEMVYSLFPRMVDRRHYKIRFLSGGERQMVSVSAGLMAAPKLLILDEPTLGLSPKLRKELSSAIQSIKLSGVPLIVVDQDVEFLESLIDTLYLFDHGRISKRIEKEDMPTHDEIMVMLFGEGGQ